MDPMGEEQLDYGDELHLPSAAVPAGAIHALADDDIDDEFDDLYSDVNVGETFVHSAARKPDPIPDPIPDPNPNPPNGSPLPPPPNPNPARAPEQLGFRPPQAPPPLPPPGPVDPTGPTMLFVGELHWWTTDAEIEDALSRYGRVKEVKFFDERASGKSKGYCQVEFHDAAAAAACKHGMDGFQFNGRSCVVTFASPQTLRQMGASYANNRNPPQPQPQPPQARRPMNDAIGRGNTGRGGWGGRGGQGMMSRGQGGMNRGSRGFNGGRVPYGQGFAPTGAMMHPQGMMGAGFDPTYMAVGGFPAPAFTGMMPPFQAVNALGLPGVAPHVNPAFFGRGMGMMGGGGGMDGQIWGDASMGPGGWMRESSNGGDDGGSEYGYGDERGDRDRFREEKDGYREYRSRDRDYDTYRSRDRDYDNEDDRDRGQSSSRSRSRMTQEDDHRPRSRDADYGKRRRIPSE